MTRRIYPINTERPWPRNQWWVAANASEVTRSPMERTILAEPVVLYRTESGAPVAVAGLCPHRNYPMVKAKVVGDALECGYHGFTFGCDGACTRIPSQDNLPGNWKIRTYPIVQKWDWVWIWTGDPALADPSQIPDPWCVGKAGWNTLISARDTLYGRYTLLIDNLFDLSHLNYIHGSVVGDVSAIVKTPVEVTKQCDSAFRLTRHVHRLPWTGFMNFMFPHKAPEPGEIRTEVFSDYYSPALTITGGPFYMESSGERLGEMNFLHGITPETESTTHYFGGVTRDFRLDDHDFDALAIGNYHLVRDQDLEAIALIEPHLDRYADTARELSALQDAGAIRIRRMLAAQIEAETRAVQIS